MSKDRSRCVLITGANGKIGEVIADRFRLEGYRVIATDKDPVANVAADFYIQCDLSLLGGEGVHLEDFVAKVKVYLPDNKLDVLVNNAATQILGSVDSILLEDWRNTLAVNLTAPFLLTQAFSGFLEAASGSVVNISSIHSKLTKKEFVAYSTSKAALDGLTRSMAIDLGGKVRVNSVNPAATDTPMLRAGFIDSPALLNDLGEMHPIGRIAQPEEIANAVFFLASEKASFITGECLFVDGGIASRLHDPG